MTLQKPTLTPIVPTDKPKLPDKHIGIELPIKGDIKKARDKLPKKLK